MDKNPYPIAPKQLEAELRRQMQSLNVMLQLTEEMLVALKNHLSDKQRERLARLMNIEPNGSEKFMFQEKHAIVPMLIHDYLQVGSFLDLSKTAMVRFLDPIQQPKLNLKKTRNSDRRIEDPKIRTVRTLRSVSKKGSRRGT